MVQVSALGEEDNGEYGHQVLRFTPRNGGGDYIIDLAGAQHGYFEPVIPYDKYVQSRVSLVVDRRHFGACKDVLMREAEQEICERSAVSSINREASKALKVGILEWEDEHRGGGLTLKKLLVANQATFERSQTEIISRMRLYLQNFLDYMERQALELRARIVAGNTQGPRHYQLGL